MYDRRLNEDAINAHNEYRKVHGCPALTLDNQLAEGAQKYAERLAYLGKLIHSDSKEYGENLATSISSQKATLTGSDASKMWYDEIKLHDFSGEFNGKSGHFTQLIWKSTVKAGFGVASTKDGHQIFIVGRYMPPGNMLGEYLKNVPPPVADSAQLSTKHILPTRPRPKIIMHGNFRRKRDRHTAPSIAVV
ncbi:Golgi-associated plant pathoproteinsis- protein 1, variant 2 [Clonorchis sinensis]|uniref:Golgi-associated plant pathoproteinsis- protein 1 n=2 Tax=Clonorchis sinensis TaxID=79923 RepID=A0A8T1LXR3_CLOSI|nr:Golgi-associated plant pathoproteinsis- protein 1 [Clonorchis sinensis]KAG5441918.1 Golgi-associated plant pathoproteinsis- protein 1, variant 2 [Clonorchis sinensis]